MGGILGGAPKMEMPAAPQPDPAEEQRRRDLEADLAKQKADNDALAAQLQKQNDDQAAKLAAQQADSLAQVMRGLRMRRSLFSDQGEAGFKLGGASTLA